ncbi:hypothetical protein TanjilG_19476 [Lupinus angustifolius]|uniref:Uncharacterized protein n=1 Tax=Lupinus angustifolius TaxID=3871 RepID=A0A1J7IGN5_LUPAN|nr:hypothetical protein TanjilG_19476 [Lupinus angustifolius]
MDPDVSRWVLEFLLRNSVPDSLIAKTLSAVPLSGADSSLKKTLLLRTLRTLHSNASITETALEILELIEEIDCNDAVPVTDSMRRAFCAVAVECTVKYLAACPDDAAGNYFAAVRRIWRGRVTRMESAGRRSGLFSEELVRWRDDLEAAVWDTRVCERLVQLNSRTEAFSEVKVYLKEAWEGIGPSFLDSVEVMTKAKGFGFDVGGESVMNSDGGDNDNDNGNHNNDGHGACGVENENQGNEKELEQRVGASIDLNHQLPAEKEKEIQKGNLQHRFKHTVLHRCHKGVKLTGTEEVEPAKSWSKCDTVPSAEVKKVRESLKSSSLELQALVKDPLADALQMSEVVRSNLAGKDINHGPSIGNQNGDVDVPDPNVDQNGDVPDPNVDQNGDVPDPNVCNSIVPFQPNDANLVKKPFVRCSNNVCCPNLLERKATARTYEWDDSLDNSPQQAQPRKRKRKWTSLEEETLRAGVNKFGEGNWAAIRGFYSDVFENRSGVDLKDKWRNMMR